MAHGQKGEAALRQVAVPWLARTLPAIGQGTWGMGRSPARRAAEVEALRLGLSLGMTLIDTAEYYAAGGAERVVGEAIRGCREQVFLVTKLWPCHARAQAVLESVHASLRRLGTDHLDAVLLHWPTRSVPLAETFRAFEHLSRAGTIGAYGVSNFGPAWLALADAAGRPAFNQVPYSLADRRVENAILPHAQSRGQVVMAWSPLGHGRLRSWGGYRELAALATAKGVTPHQAALAYLASRAQVVSIPKAARLDHVRANAAAGDIALSPDEMQRLEAAFPRGPQHGFPILPPVDPVFRLLLWFERRRHGG